MEPFVIAAAVLCVLLLGLAVKLTDLKRRRASEAAQVQGHLSDALLAEPALSRLPVVPTVQVPLWRGSPAIVQLTGQVPTIELWTAVIVLVEQEAARIRPDVHIYDGLTIAATADRRAA